MISLDPAVSAKSAAVATKERFGVYVHFPYCLQKCPYCDFLSVKSAREEIPHARYADAVLRELEARRAAVEGLELRSVFFGGGTPSLWNTAELGRVLEGVLESFPERAASLEISVECNPSSFDVRVGRALRACGVNRVSLGVQSLDAGRLAFLGRLHDAEGALAALAAAQSAELPRVSADLIFGVAGQSPAQAVHEALSVAERGVTHLSAYALTVEPGTVFGERARHGRLPLLGEDAVAESFAQVEAALEARGFEHYEVSNYAQPGARAEHNLGYWRGEPYLGLGAGAWGTLPRRADGRRLRYRNTPAHERYLGWAEQRGSVELEREGPLVATVERLVGETYLKERLMLGLRLAEGLNVRDAEARSESTLWTPDRLRAKEKWQKRGALVENAGWLAIPRSHWLLADGIVADLL